MRHLRRSAIWALRRISWSATALLAILSMIILRGSDLWANGSYMVSHPRYWTIYNLEALMLFTGIVLIGLYEVEHKYRHLGSLLYAILSGVALVIDPDFPHFITNPLIFLSTDLVYTALLSFGAPITAILLVAPLKATRQSNNLGEIEHS